ncbi:hypothetical protein K438DRAFT_1807612, partial [Mycena galopus ATCC 62051]
QARLRCFDQYTVRLLQRDACMGFFHDDVQRCSPWSHPRRKSACASHRRCVACI